MTDIKVGSLVRADDAMGFWYIGRVKFLHASGTIARLEVTDPGTSRWKVGAVVDCGVVRLTAINEEDA